MVEIGEKEKREILDGKIKSLVVAYDALIEYYHSDGFSLKQSIKKTDELLQ